jgi:hypothetical protein
MPGRPVPYALKLVLALAQNRLPDPDQDERGLIDGRGPAPRSIPKYQPGDMDSRGRRPRRGTGGGRRAPVRATAERLSGHEKPDHWRSRITYIIEGFSNDKLSLRRRPADPPIEPTTPILKSPSASSAPPRMSLRERRRLWAKRDQPASVSREDWELVRLTTVDGLKVPEIIAAKLPAYRGVRADALRQRITRARKAAGLTKLPK